MSGASFLELKAFTKDFFPDLLELLEGVPGLLAGEAQAAPSKLGTP